MAGPDYAPIGGEQSKGNKICIGCLCCLICTFIVGFGVVQYVAYNMIALQFVQVTKKYSRPLSVTPETALEPYTKEGQQPWVCDNYVKTFHDTAKESAKHFKDKGWINLTLTSRADPSVPTVNLTAFYFESPLKTKNAPTIIVQHGNNVNNRDHTVITAGYYLNSMGFNVILANLRNHGDSGHVGHLTWAQQDSYDVLGVWDYVVSDPEGLLGGKKQPSQVAVMGFSMGGLVSTVAFLVEPRIAALLTDGAVFDAKRELEYLINKQMPGLAMLLLPSAWFWASYLSGEDLSKLSPKHLHKEGDKRPLANIHATDDVLVPIEQTLLQKKALAAVNKHYLMEWYEKTVPDSEQAKCTPHCEMHLAHPDKYKHFLCNFFSKVFDRKPDKCGLSQKSTSFPTKAVVERKLLHREPSFRIDGHPQQDGADRLDGSWEQWV